MCRFAEELNLRAPLQVNWIIAKKLEEMSIEKIEPGVCLELAFKGCLKWNTQCIPTRSQLMNKLLNKVNMEIELWNMLSTLCVSDHTLSKYPGVLYVYICVSVCIEPSADAEGCFSPWNCNIILTVSFSRIIHDLRNQF